jgi:chaperonin cofactor prefoldin
MSDELVNQLFANIETQRVEIETLQANNNILTSEKESLQKKVDNLT